VLVLIDAQLSPALAPWLRRTFAVDAVAVRDLGLPEAEDAVIFAAAREREPGSASQEARTATREVGSCVSRTGCPPGAPVELAMVRLCTSMPECNMMPPGESLSADDRN
jgi:hypothetical protein